MHRLPDRSDNGVTLIELLVTLSLGAILSGLAGVSLTSWVSSNSHKASRDEVLSGLRNASQQALSEGRTYCLAFATDGTWKTYQKSCDSAGVLVSSGRGVNDKGSTLAPSFSYLTGQTSACTTATSTTACAYFYPRGTAAAGTVSVTRPGKPTYTVTVEQLTSRVYTN